MADALPVPGKAASLLKLLEEGPGLTAELAAELAISSHNASTHLHNLAKSGKVQKAAFPQGADRPAVLWHLKAYRP